MGGGGDGGMMLQTSVEQARIIKGRDKFNSNLKPPRRKISTSLFPSSPIGQQISPISRKISISEQPEIDELKENVGKEEQQKEEDELAPVEEIRDWWHQLDEDEEEEEEEEDENELGEDGLEEGGKRRQKMEKLPSKREEMQPPTAIFD